MRQTSFGDMSCSLARTLEVVGDWWSPLIIRDLYLGLDHFDQLVTDLGISRNLLTDRLSTLRTGGVISRQIYQENPARYRYVLTEAGADLVPVLLAMTAWGDRWVAPQAGPPMRFRHDSCGHLSTPVVTCSECTVPLTGQDVTVIAGPGGRTAPGTALIATVLSV